MTNRLRLHRAVIPAGRAVEEILPLFLGDPRIVRYRLQPDGSAVVYWYAIESARLGPGYEGRPEVADDKDGAALAAKTDKLADSAVEVMKGRISGKKARRVAAALLEHSDDATTLIRLRQECGIDEKDGPRLIALVGKSKPVAPPKKPEKKESAASAAKA